MIRYRIQCVVLALLVGGSVAAGQQTALVDEISQSYRQDSCANQALRPVEDAYQAYVESGKARRNGKAELADLYARCAIHLGGATALYNLAGNFKDVGDSRALDYYLASALMGNRKAKSEAGETLLKFAQSERQRLIALNLLASANEGCEWHGGERLAKFAETSVYPPALIAARTWLRVHLDDLARSGRHVSYYKAWLSTIEKNMSDTMRNQSDAAAAELARDRVGCDSRDHPR